MSERGPVGAVEGSAPVERRPVTVLEAHTLADCAEPAACWWLPHRAADQSLPSAPIDGLAGSDEAVAVSDDELEAVAQAAFGVARAGGGVSEMAAAMLPELRLLVARVRAEAVAEERQRVVPAALREIVAEVRTRYPLLGEPDPISDWAAGVAWMLNRLTSIAAGSVPVATPAEPVARCGEKRSQSDADAHWLNAEQYDSVALCCDEPAGHPGDHCCNEGKPGHDTWPNHEPRPVAAGPSVGTATPAGQCGCTACTPDGPIDGKCRCDVCIRSAIWHPESTCTCRLCRYAHSLRNLDVLTAALRDSE